MTVNARTRIETNPFCVLQLPVDCGRADVERTAAMLLAKLELGLVDAMSYDTPLGPRPRTPELVRKAAAELRDPAARLGHEFWALRDANLPVAAPEPEDETTAQDPDPSAMALLRWRAR